MPEKKSNLPKDEPQSESRLSDEHLSDVSAGATEELHGAYNFLLEVAGVTDQNQSTSDLEFLKKRAARSGYSVE